MVVDFDTFYMCVKDITEKLLIYWERFYVGVAFTPKSFVTNEYNIHKCTYVQNT